MGLHPATRLLLFLALAAILPRADAVTLGLFSLGFAGLLRFAGAAKFRQLVRRARWLLASLALIYGFATPGEAVVPALGFASPTIEGLAGGALQAWRLLVMFGGLSLLLATTPRDELLEGLYCLLRPLDRVGADAERIAARLALTLHYAEHPGLGGLLERLNAGFAPAPAPTAIIRIERHPVTWRDGLALGAAAAVAGAVLW